MLLSRPRQSIHAIDHLSPAASSNRNWLKTNHHHHHPISPNDDDNDEDEPSVNYERSLCDNTTSDLLLMMMAAARDPHRPSSFASCNKWSFDTPSPVCSSSPHNSQSQVSTADEPSFATPNNSSCIVFDDIEQETSTTPCISKMGEVEGRSSKNSIGTSNYYADDDDGGRLLAVTEEQEEGTPEVGFKHAHHPFSSGSGSYDGSGYENSDIESMIEEERIKSTVQARRPKNKLADKLSAWKEARTMKIMNTLKREEAAIDEREKKKATKARMEMKELEMKWENKREREMQNMQKRIRRAQKEAEKKKVKKRAAAAKKIAEVAKVFDKAANTGKLSCWLLYLSRLQDQ